MFTADDGSPLAGYNITIYSDPKTTTTDADGNYGFTGVSFDHHTMVITDSGDNEIGRFELQFAQGSSNSASIDNAANIANITYKRNISGINMSLQANSTITDFDVNDITFAVVSQQNNSIIMVNPKTGNDSLSLWWLMAVLGVFALSASIYSIKKRKM